ncbi:MAG: SpoVR family protein [Alphaproteobacteria bacterium]|nr:SpoVR family protein [Alphaproteobacteria bacterium]
MTKLLEKNHQRAKEKIDALLNNYEEGRDIFKNAAKANKWDYPVNKKEHAKDDPTLPDNWLDLVETVFRILAEEKYGLETYHNHIEIITANQMLDSYASVGMPESYEHWSFGKRRIVEEQKYKQQGGGLAFEIVINTDPAIAYCMKSNTPLMQMLVIAHASIGHNNFFKENCMFKQFTEADNIRWRIRDLRKTVQECGEKYGLEEVEKLLDMCHAVGMHAVDHYTKKNKGRTRTLQDQFEQSVDKDDPEKPIIVDSESNLLTYIADNAPHLPDWKRDIMRKVAYTRQYFYPQAQTKVMNEGWASFWHYTLLHDMSDLDLIDAGMMQEFFAAHAQVLFQPDFDAAVYVLDKEGKPVIGPDGKPKTRSIYNGINPYTMGFAMFEDIKRICEEPTEEDYEKFPDIAGSQDWVSVLKHAMENFKDDTFFLQYLSPKVIRDFKLFAVNDDDENDYIEISAIHTPKGYQKIREVLANNHRLSSFVPNLTVERFYESTDRRLVIHHRIKDRQPLDEKDADLVLRHLYSVWGHRVVLKSVTPEGEVIKEMSCPSKPRMKTSNNNQPNFI